MFLLVCGASDENAIRNKIAYIVKCSERNQPSRNVSVTSQRPKSQCTFALCVEPICMHR